MSTSPPYLRGEQVGRLLHSAYTQWAEHHRQCATCGVQDWYIPGDFVEVKQPPCDLTHDRDSAPRYFVRAADVSVLCREGSMLFKSWEHNAMQQETVYQNRKEEA